MKIIWIAPKTNIKHYIDLEKFPLLENWFSLITKAKSQFGNHDYNYQFCVDRTNTILFPMKTIQFDLSNYIMPELFFNKICLLDIIFKRCDEIFSKTDEKILLLYSGGVDSTCMLIGFLMKFGIKQCNERIIICSNDSSYKTCSSMIDFLIKNNFQFENSSDSENLFVQEKYKNNIILNGDPANIFDGSILLNYIVKNKIDISSKNWKTIIQKNYNDLFHGNNEKCIEYLFDSMIQSALSRNFIIDNVADFCWWYNNNFRYITESLNLIKNYVSVLKEFPYGKKFWTNKFISFFATDEFTQWSFNYKDQLMWNKINLNEKDSYKIPFINIITNYHKQYTEADYYSNNRFSGKKNITLIDENYRSYK